MDKVSTEKVMPFGLEDKVVNRIIAVLQKFPEVDEVIIYGSRAKGNYKPGSDIDLTVKGNLDQRLLNKIDIELDDLLLPYTFDLSVYSHIKNENLLDHIER